MARFGELYEQWGVYMTDERPTGAPPDELAVHLTLDGPHLDRKLAALAAMASQTGTAMSTLDRETYAASVAEESFVDARPVTDIQRSSQLMVFQPDRGGPDRRIPST